MKVLYVGRNTKIETQLNADNWTQLTRVESVAEAVIQLHRNPEIGLILTDYILQGNTAFEFYERINSDARFQDMPVVVMQEAFDPEVFQKARELGFSDYYVLDKDTPHRLKERIRELTEVPAATDLETKTHSNRNSFRIPTSKRIFDILVASSLLLVLSPLLLLIVIAIRLESKGKIYYTSKRVGRKTFDFYKLRSMRVGADAMLKELAKEKNQYAAKPTESAVSSDTCTKCEKLPEGEYCSPLNYDGGQVICDHMHTQKKQRALTESSSFVKIVDDPRITRIGKIIRNTSIDELPQLINVIKGDMSLVGNRPLPVYEAECLTQDELSKRFLAPAGITGLWQVELRGKGGDMSEEERIALDNTYADYFTNGTYFFWLDVKILLRTIPALFQQSTV